MPETTPTPSPKAPHPDQEGAHPETQRETGPIVAGPDAREASKEDAEPKPADKA